VQLPEEEGPEAIFSDYAYFSSYSETWLRHAETYAAAMIERFGLGPGHQVIEVASNDGYLLRWFAARGIPVQASSRPATWRGRRSGGHPHPGEVLRRGHGARAGGRGTRADLLVGNNVLAHVPNLNDFVAGLKLLLAPTGVLTMEFPISCG